jgi:hypothetical protein
MVLKVQEAKGILAHSLIILPAALSDGYNFHDLECAIEDVELRNTHELTAKNLGLPSAILLGRAQ